MTSSISIVSSGGSCCYTSNSDTQLNKTKEFKYEDYYNGLEAELRDIRTARQNREDTRSYTIRRNNLFSRNSNQIPLNNSANNLNLKDVSFYDEVDERMSRNSMEYPEQQAKYAHVSRWLNADQQATLNNLTSSPDLGNVIGIRGYLNGLNCGHEDELRRQRANYNKLKFNHLKLASDFERLRIKFSDFIEKSRKVFQQKDQSIEVLKRGLREKRKRLKLHNDIKTTELSLIDELKNELATLKVQLLDRDEKLKAINCDKSSETNSIKEVELLRKQLKSLSLDPNNRSVLQLRNQNEQLKIQTEVDAREFYNLKQSYLKLENQVKALLVEKKSLEEEKNSEISRLLIELCRYQVQLPKLEMILKTEREIKSEYQNKLLRLEEDKDSLVDKLNNSHRELANQRARNEANQAAELDKVTRELSLWQDKYDRLKREKIDTDELVRSMRLKLSSLDNQKLSKEDQLNESHKREVERLQAKVGQLNEREATFATKVDDLNQRLNDSESLRKQLVLDVQSLNRKLESLRNMADNNNRLKESRGHEENQSTAMREILDKLEFDNRELSYELKTLRALNDRQKQQLQDVQQRFKLQQKTLEELKKEKEQEVSKLRCDLNFEKYNRQVALRNMERQMKIGLRELEHVKSQFVQGRRIPAHSNGQANDLGTSSSTCCQTSEKSIKNSANSNTKAD